MADGTQRDVEVEMNELKTEVTYLKRRVYLLEEATADPLMGNTNYEPTIHFPSATSGL